MVMDIPAGAPPPQFDQAPLSNPSLSKDDGVPPLVLLLEVIVIVAGADCVASATLVAVTVTLEEGTVAGAVYRPAEVIVPTVELPAAAPFTLQVTPVLLLPEMVAVNCMVPPVCTVAELGEREADTPLPALLPLEVLPVVLQGVVLMQKSSV